MNGRAVVAGGGLGGLAAALRLASAGWRVTLCERGPTLGGKMNRWESEGFRFDTGPSLITMPWVFEELFADCGERLADHVALKPLRPLARYVYPDGTAFDYATSMPEWLETVRALEPRDVDGFLRYMELGARLYHLSRDTFLTRPVTAPPDAASLAALRHFPLRHAWGNYHRTVAAHFRSPYLRQLFDRYPTYVGSSPYRTPATLTLVPYIEYAFGGWYVEGGLYRLVEVLAALLERRGVDLRTSAPVARIIHQGSRVTGVELESGETLAADVAVMNGDVTTTAQLIGNENVAPGSREDRSLSGVVLLLGLRGKLSGVHHHNVFFSTDYPQEFRELFELRRFPTDPTVYVNIPTVSDPALAPEGGEALFIMANAPADAGSWDEQGTRAARDAMLGRLRASGFPLNEADIVTELAITPKWMAGRYAMPGGAIYGSHSHGWRRAFLRTPNKNRRIGGLYHVTGSGHPGGGTPIVLLAAKIAAGLIARHEEEPS